MLQATKLRNSVAHVFFFPSSRCCVLGEREDRKAASDCGDIKIRENCASGLRSPALSWLRAYNNCDAALCGRFLRHGE